MDVYCGKSNIENVLRYDDPGEIAAGKGKTRPRHVKLSGPTLGPIGFESTSIFTPDENSSITTPENKS